MTKKKLTYEEMNDKQKANYDKWMARSEAMSKGGKNTSKVGGAMMGIGCLMTIFITIPIILIIIFLL